jgi:DNA-binding IclR family transcriptional regulator
MILPSLTRFVERTKTSLGFWRRIDRQRIMLAGFVDSPNLMRIHMTVGQRLPLFIGAVGRAFAAELGLDEAEIAKELAKLRWQSPPDLQDYLRQVGAYRQLGYAIDDGNFALGVTTVATVLRDVVGGSSFGLSAIRIGGHTDDEEMRAIGSALVELKREITSNWLGRN